jgi:hypothetical protein
LMPPIDAMGRPARGAAPDSWIHANATMRATMVSTDVRDDPKFRLRAWSSSQRGHGLWLPDNVRVEKPLDLDRTMRGRLWGTIMAGIAALLAGCGPAPVLADGTVAVSPATGPSLERLRSAEDENR